MFILRSIRLTQSLPKQAYRYTNPARSMTGLAGLLSNRYKVEDIPDQTGKVAIVTGGSAGIGQQIVNDLVQKGAEVHIISATREHAEETVEKISKNVPDASSKIHHHAIDLGNLQSIVDLLPKLQSLPRIDQLYLIAGVGVAPFGLTKDGLGNHFAVNHLSHFLLVDGLLPKLKETSESKQSGSEEERFSTRIITESSELHRTARAEIKCDSVEEFNQEDDANRLYARSKLLGIWFTKQLAQHLPPLASSSPILAIAVHPGAVATEQQKGATEAYGLLGKALEVAAAVGFMSPEQGSESALWAGTAPAVAQRREEAQGAYFTEADGKVGTETAQAQEAETARKLWDLSVKVLKDKLNYEVKM